MDNEMRIHTILVILEIAKTEEIFNEATSYIQKPGPTRKGNCNTAPEQRDSAAAWTLRWMYGSNRTGCCTGNRCRGMCVFAQRCSYLRLRSSNVLFFLSYESKEIIVDNTHANVQELVFQTACASCGFRPTMTYMMHIETRTHTIAVMLEISKSRDVFNDATLLHSYQRNSLSAYDSADAERYNQR